MPPVAIARPSSPACKGHSLTQLSPGYRTNNNVKYMIMNDWPTEDDENGMKMGILYATVCSKAPLQCDFLKGSRRG